MFDSETLSYPLKENHLKNDKKNQTKNGPEIEVVGPEVTVWEIGQQVAMQVKQRAASARNAGVSESLAWRFGREASTTMTLLGDLLISTMLFTRVKRPYITR